MARLRSDGEVTHNTGLMGHFCGPAAESAAFREHVKPLPWPGSDWSVVLVTGTGYGTAPLILQGIVRLPERDPHTATA